MNACEIDGPTRFTYIYGATTTLFLHYYIIKYVNKKNQQVRLVIRK